MVNTRHNKPRGQKTESETDLKFEIKFFRGLVRRDPTCIEALQILGDAYTKTGQYRRGLQIDRKLARLCPTNPLVFYNLACSLSLLKEIDEAFGALNKAIELGYTDLPWLQKDTDLDNLREDARFEQVRKKLQAKRRRRKS